MGDMARETRLVMRGLKIIGLDAALMGLKNIKPNREIS
jgi:hypothetical protein